jgi:pyruvate/2-oxoglutarate/acetoin dehydrogenase E1 component
LSHWFKNFEGWNVVVPTTPDEAHEYLINSVKSDRPTIYVIYRELFDSDSQKVIPEPTKVTLCGASRRHERDYYAKRDAGLF